MENGLYGAPDAPISQGAWRVDKGGNTYQTGALFVGPPGNNTTPSISIGGNNTGPYANSNFGFGIIVNGTSVMGFDNRGFSNPICSFGGGSQVLQCNSYAISTQIKTGLFTTTSNDGIGICVLSGNNPIFTLPAVNVVPVGREYTFILGSNTTGLISGINGQVINGSTSYPLLSQGEFVKIASLGTASSGWIITSSNRYGNLNQASGQVGINNTNPQYNLDVSGNIGCSGINIGINGVNSNGNLNLKSNSSLTGMVLSGGYINLYGNTSGTAPSTTLLNLPIAENIYGGTAAFLGSPEGWIDIYISGILRKLPYF